MSIKIHFVQNCLFLHIVTCRSICSPWWHPECDFEIFLLLCAELGLEELRAGFVSLCSRHLFHRFWMFCASQPHFQEHLVEMDPLIWFLSELLGPLLMKLAFQRIESSCSVFSACEDHCANRRTIWWCFRRHCMLADMLCIHQSSWLHSGSWVFQEMCWRHQSLPLSTAQLFSSKSSWWGMIPSSESSVLGIRGCLLLLASRHGQDEVFWWKHYRLTCQR